MMDNIVYDVRWSNLVDDKYRTDFLTVQQEVFDYGTVEEFQRQYENNPYGESVLVIAYKNSIPVGARSFWRNDIGKQEAYQPGSTCVSKSCRGLGIFREMTIRALAMVPPNAIIYNFPNPNSYPGYLKMGWTLLMDYSVRLYTSYDKYHKEHPLKMDNEYAHWWIDGRHLYYKKIGIHYFLLHKNYRPFCYCIFAEVSQQIAVQFPKASFGFVFYNSGNCPWYSKRFLKSHVVGRNTGTIYIPVWKIDSIQ